MREIIFGWTVKSALISEKNSASISMTPKMKGERNGLLFYFYFILYYCILYERDYLRLYGQVSADIRKNQCQYFNDPKNER